MPNKVPGTVKMQKQKPTNKQKLSAEHNNARQPRAGECHQAKHPAPAGHQALRDQMTDKPHIHNTQAECVYINCHIHINEAMLVWRVSQNKGTALLEKVTRHNNIVPTEPYLETGSHGLSSGTENLSQRHEEQGDPSPPIHHHYQESNLKEQEALRPVKFNC